MRDEFNEWKRWTKASGFLREQELSTQLGCSTALNNSWCGWEARAKLIIPMSHEQRKAVIESAINAIDDGGSLLDTEQFAWVIEAVERAHGIV